MNDGEHSGPAAATRTVTLRTAAAVALMSGWLVLLCAGWIAGGAVHLLFAAALVLFPWRAALHRGIADRPDASDEIPAGASAGDSEEETP